MSKPDILRITDALGADAICDRLGVGLHSVRFARTEGRFPAAWYGPLKAMCEERGIDCPMDIFNWKVPVATQKGAA